MLYTAGMIDPRIKGFMVRLTPSMLIAAGVSFCLFTLMSVMIASDQATILVPQAKVIKVKNIQPVEDTIFIRADVVEVLPKSFFVKPLDKPSELNLSLPQDYSYETKMAFESIERVATLEKIDISLSPIIDRDAILLAISNPMYPYSAEKAHIEGHVVVAMNVGIDGKVDDAWVVEASPAGYFENDALRAAKKFKYRPRIKNGKKVMASNLKYRWDFDLPEGD